MGTRQLLYAFIDDPEKVLTLNIVPAMTNEQILNELNSGKKKKYNHIYLNKQEVKEKEIYNLIDPIQKTVFVITTELSPPSDEFLDRISKVQLIALINHLPWIPKLDFVLPLPTGIPLPLPAEIPLPLPTDPSSSESSTPTTPTNPTEFANINETITYSETNTGINSVQEKKRFKEKNGKFIFCFTGYSEEMLLNGIEVELTKEMTPNQVRDSLLNQLPSNFSISNRQLIVYLAGGLPFIGGTLEDVYFNSDAHFKKVIYGVFTQRIPDNLLKMPINEVCNISDSDHRALISPLCSSTKRGLSDIACLVGYLAHDGIKYDLLQKSFATVIHFPPLLTAMSRINSNDLVTGRDIVTLCSTIYTYFRAKLPSTCVDEKVFEYGLRLCNLISHVKKIPEKIPMQTIAIDPDDSGTFLNRLKLGPTVYLWGGDVKNDVPLTKFSFKTEEAIENAYKVIASFTPIAPLSMSNANGCSIVKGRDYEYLYLYPSQNKSSSYSNQAHLIDPFKGFAESVDIIEFSKSQGDSSSEEIENLIDPDKVQQITMVDLDESTSMLADLNGFVIDKRNRLQIHRITIAFQFLSIFANRTYRYRIPCIQGLTSFNQRVTVRCPLSPLVPDFEEKGFNIQVQKKALTNLWESILRCCDEIIKYRKDSKGNEKFKNAQSRILVISDGADSSGQSPESALKKAIENNIIVDSIIINTDDDEVEKLKTLAVLCHSTGGICYRLEVDKSRQVYLNRDYIPIGIRKALSLFEQTAFLNIKERQLYSEELIPSITPNSLKKKLSTISSSFFTNAAERVTFDTEVLNKSTNHILSSNQLATPRHVVSMNRNSSLDKSRTRRILRELYQAAKVNENSPDNNYFDPDMKIYTLKSNFEKWIVFIRSQSDSHYGSKWWKLLVTFPELYPIQPPIFRFASVPYHLNVSNDGRICLDIIEKGYIPTKNVYEICQEIKELFLRASPETFVQLDIFTAYVENRNLYFKLARKSALDNAKDDINDFLNNCSVFDNVDSDFRLIFDDYVPPHLVSQVSGQIMSDENKVLASSGVYYTRSDLKRILSSSNPICPVTGKQLTESLDSI